MNLTNIIVHHIEKQRGADASLNLRDEVLPIGQTLIEFTESVRDVYYKKSNPSWGIFDPKLNEDESL